MGFYAAGVEPSNERRLPASVGVDAELDVDRLWEDFEIFEALHHSMAIANPFTSDDLDAVVALLDPQPGDTVVDIATGSGELVRRLVAHTGASATGIDLSPWMVRNAARAPAAAPPIRWVLTDGRHLAERRSSLGIAGEFDLVSCLGASWIWHGLPGTVAALAALVAPGGRVAVGDMHVRADCDPSEVPPGLRREAKTAPEELFGRHGLRLLGSVTATDASWDAYLARTATDARTWQARFPGPAADRYVAEQADWVDDHHRDRRWRSWTVWVATTV